MWQQGAPLSLLSVLPDGTPAPDGGFVEPSLGAAEGLNTRRAISEDGSRVFWTDGDGHALYMRDTVTRQTIRLNSAQGHGAIRSRTGRARSARTPRSRTRSTRSALPGRKRRWLEGRSSQTPHA